MAHADERLMEWLQDAHAMEEQAEIFLQFLADHVENHPEIKVELHRLCDQTKDQARRIRACIERRAGNGSYPPLKFQVSGRARANRPLIGDAIGTATLASFVFAHMKRMEIGAYALLVAAATEAGDQETAEVCGGILQEDQAMSSWLGKELLGGTHASARALSHPS